MAEPFSAASAALSTLDIMLRAAKKARRLYQNWKDAPAQIRTLLDELEHFSLVVEVAKQNQQNTHQNALAATAQRNIAAALQKRLQSSQPLWDELDAHTKDCGQHLTKENFKRRKWTFAKTKTDGIRARLAEERIWIVEILGLSDRLSSETISQQLVAINTKIQTNYQTALTHLVQHPQSNADLLATVNVVRTLLQDNIRLGNDVAVTTSLMHGLVQEIHSVTTSRRTLQAPKVPSSPPSHQSRASTTSTSNNTLVSQQVQVSQNRNLVQIKVTEGRKSPCLSSCTCSCHKKQQHWNLFTFWLLRRWFGLAYVSKITYADPKTCTDELCGNTGFNSLEMGYAFPEWLCSVSVHAIFMNPMLGKPSAGLVLRRRVTYWDENSIARLTDEEDITTMQMLLIKKRIFLDDLDPKNGGTALQRAVGSGRLTTARFMLRFGADPDIWDDMGSTARDEAIFAYFASFGDYQESDREELQELFAVHAHIDSWDLSFLHKVVLGLIPIAIEALDVSRSFRDQVNATDRHGRTALHWAAIRADINAATCLIEAGANVNAKDVYYKTPLHFAAESCCLGVFRLLLKFHADPKARTKMGEQPAHKVCRSVDNPEFLSLLVAAGADVHATAHGPTQFTNALAAIGTDNAPLLEELIRLGADVTSSDAEGDTPLFETLISGSLDCLALMLERSDIIDYKHKNLQGQTLLHFAAMFGYDYIFDLLAERKLIGLDPEAKDCEGKTAADHLPKNSPDSHWSAFKRLLESVRQANHKAMKASNHQEDGNVSGEEDVFYDCDEDLL